MKGKNIFTPDDIYKLIDLIKLRNSTSSLGQKAIRQKMRALGFYGRDDWGIIDLQVADLDLLISLGKIKVKGDDFEKPKILANAINHKPFRENKETPTITSSNDINFVLKKFRSNPFDPSVDSELKVSDTEGNYLLCLRRNSKLPNCNIAPICQLFEGLEVLYTGIASISLRTRDLRQHFEGNNAGRSTIRKSLGVIWGFKQIPRDKDPKTGKTKFNFNDEQKLSVWMRTNLVMYTLPTTNYEKIEIMLINHFNPPFNLKRNKNIVNKDFRQMLSSLRGNK